MCSPLPALDKHWTGWQTTNLGENSVPGTNHACPTIEGCCYIKAVKSNICS